MDGLLPAALTLVLGSLEYDLGKLVVGGGEPCIVTLSSLRLGNS